MLTHWLDRIAPVQPGEASTLDRLDGRGTMDEKRLNGFTIIAHEWGERHGDYVILGARRTGPGSYEYVTARMLNFDQDTTWYWGNYINNVADAVADFHNRITR